MASMLSFLAVASVAMLVPGPDTFVVLRSALAGGAAAGVWAALGAALGNLLWGAASVAGVAALLAASPGAETALKLAGGLYVAVLGLQALRAAARMETLLADDAAVARAGRAASLRRGLASDLLNVKVGLFWTALVPQFAGADAGPLLPAAMVVTMFVLVFAWLSAYALLGARLRQRLSGGRAARVLNGGVGGVLVALGATLAFAS